MKPPVVPPPHAPEIGRMGGWLGSFHVTGVFWYRLHRWGVSILPEWGIRFFLLIFTTFFFVILRRIRRAMAANLEVVLGPCGWWRRQVRLYRTMWNFAWCLSERYERLGNEHQNRVEIEGKEFWDQALAAAAGFLLITAHIGHWEVGSMVPSSYDQRHVHVVREEEMDKQAQAFLRQLFADQKIDGLTMHFAKDDAMLGTRLLGALRRGEIVALQGDRPRATGRSLTVEMFGKPFELPIGPAALARAAGAPLLPVFVFRLGRRSSHVVFRPLIRVSSTGDRDQAIRHAVEKVAREVEWAIRRQPHQWFCFRELWPGSAASPPV